MKSTPCHQILRVALAIITAGCASVSAAKIQYDLTRDFSTNRNPNGVWSYNYNSSPIATCQTFWWGETGWGNLWIGDGCILKGSQPTGTDPWGVPILPAHDWQPGDVMMHALSIPYGGDSAFLNATWTSPADGTIDIVGRAWEGEIFADRDVGWVLAVGGKVVAQRASVKGLYRSDSDANLAANLLAGNTLADIRVAKGDVVEFRVVAESYYGQFVGVQLNVTLTARSLPAKVHPGKHQYDFTSDWSNTRNPNGVWAYNYNTSPISTFQTFWWGEAGWGNMWIGDGCILKGNQPTGTDPWGVPILPAHDWHPGDVMMAAVSIPYGGDSTFLNFTWTSPADGFIDITGRAWEGEIFDDREVAWALIVRGQTIAQRPAVRGLYRTDPGADFNANLVGSNTLSHIQVAQGDVVEFRVMAQTYYGHFVGVQEHITLKARGLPPLPTAAVPRSRSPRLVTNAPGTP